MQGWGTRKKTPSLEESLHPLTTQFLTADYLRPNPPRIVEEVYSLDVRPIVATRENNVLFVLRTLMAGERVSTDLLARAKKFLLYVGMSTLSLTPSTSQSLRAAPQMPNITLHTHYNMLIPPQQANTNHSDPAPTNCPTWSAEPEVPAESTTNP